MSADHQDESKFSCCNSFIVLGHDRTCKNKEQEPTDLDKVNGPCLWYDNEKLPNTLYVSIPLRLLAGNPVGTCLLRGWITEFVEGMSLAIIRKLRMLEAEKASRVIVPGGAGGNGQPVPLQVH